MNLKRHRDLLTHIGMIFKRGWLLVGCLLSVQVRSATSAANRPTSFALAYVYDDSQCSSDQSESGVVDGIVFSKLPQPWVCCVLTLVLLLALMAISGRIGYIYGYVDTHQEFEKKTEGEEADSSDEEDDDDDDSKIELRRMSKAEGTYTRYRYQTHLLFEDPTSSSAAFVVSALMLLLVIGSCVIIFVTSLPSINPDIHPENRNIFNNLDLIMTIGFTIEWIGRLWAAPLRVAFLMDVLNLCDLATILPVWIEIFSGENTINLQFLRVMRLMKIFRFFKMVRINKDLQILALTIEKSSRYLKLLGYGLSIAAFMMACGMHTFEGGVWDAKKGCSVREDGECSPFESVPMSIYFAVTTMTTVGYGDNCPITVVGKVIALMGQAVGVFVIAMPVTVLGADFMDTYTEVKTGRFHYKNRRGHNMYEHFGKVEEHLKDFIAELRGHIGKQTTGISDKIFDMSLRSIERDILAGLADAQEILTESYKEAHAQRKILKANRIIEQAAKILAEKAENEEDPG